MIYFIQDLRDAMIKIGYSDNPYRRLKQLNEEFDDSLVLLGMMDGNRYAERPMQAKFAHSWVYSEWFRPTPDLIKFIAVNAILPPMAEFKEFYYRWVWNIEVEFENMLDILDDPFGNAPTKRYT